MTNIGVRLFSLCTITISMLVGSVISYGILQSYMKTMQGIWHPHDNHKPYMMLIGISIGL
jgi:hypothetical protein